MRLARCDFGADEVTAVETVEPDESKPGSARYSILHRGGRPGRSHRRPRNDAEGVRKAATAWIRDALEQFSKRTLLRAAPARDRPHGMVRTADCETGGSLAKRNPT